MSKQGSESSAVIKQGPVQTKSRRFGILKSRWFVLYDACSLGLTRLVKYDNDKRAADDNPISQIHLQEVNSIVRATGDEGARVVSLQLMDHSLRQFTCETEGDATDWLNKLTVAHRAASRRQSLAKGVFMVFLMPSATLSFFGECFVAVNDDTIQLYKNERLSDSVVYWKMESIRRLGNDLKNQRIMLEVGRGSGPSGEGIYLLRSFQHDDLHTLISQKMKQLLVQ